MRQLRSSESSIRPVDTINHTDETVQHAEERTVKARVQTESYHASVLVPRTTSTRDITALETAMQGLAPDAWHPVALELAATASSRDFLLRATSAISLRHLADQVQARYPQAIIRQLAEEDDPLAQREGEVVSTVELRAGAAAYLPLRILRERELLQEGDHLLGHHQALQVRQFARCAAYPGSAALDHRPARGHSRGEASAGQHGQRRGRGRSLRTDRHRPAGSLRGGAR